MVRAGFHYFASKITFCADVIYSALTLGWWCDANQNHPSSPVFNLQFSSNKLNETQRGHHNGLCWVTVGLEAAATGREVCKCNIMINIL